jgi:hypothetical protein
MDCDRQPQIAILSAVVEVGELFWRDEVGHAVADGAQVGHQRDHANSPSSCCCWAVHFPRPTGMTSFVQSSQAKLAPALPTLLDAVQMH